MKLSYVPFLVVMIFIFVSCSSSGISEEERTLEALAQYSSSEQTASKMDSSGKLSSSSVVPSSNTIKPRESEVSKVAPTPTSVSVAGIENSRDEDHMMNARNLLQQGLAEEAIEELENAILKDPDNLEAYAGKVEIRLGIGDLDLALVELNLAIEKFQELAGNSDKISQHLKYLYVVKAQSHEQLNQLEESESSYDDLVRIAPEDSIGYSGRAWIKFKLGELEDSTEDFEKSLMIDSSNVMNLYFATFPYLYLGDYERVIELTNKIIDLDPLHGNAYSRKGLANSGLGEYNLALQNLNKAIEIHSDRSNYYMERSFVYEALENSELADKDRNIACKLHEQFGGLDNPMLCLSAPTP